MKFLLLAFAIFATLALTSANSNYAVNYDTWFTIPRMPLLNIQTVRLIRMPEPVLAHVHTVDHEYPHVHFTETVFSFPIMGLYLQFFERVEDADWD